MKGRDQFNVNEANEIRARLREVRKAPPGVSQKLIRDQLRAVGFYISDWPRHATGFTASDFEELISSGQIAILGDSEAVEPTRHPPRSGRPAVHSPAAGGAPPALTTRGGPPSSLIAQARAALEHAGYALTEAHEYVPNSPGLYALHASTETWLDLELGRPPDARPLYVGKAEESLVTRDLTTHFGDGRTGSSTVRRSFAALLRGTLELSGMPRNPEKPGYYANFGLSPDHDARLTAWMRRRLTLAVWPKPGDAELITIERALLAEMKPPLNLKDVQTPWSARVSEARKRMADEARTWARARGFDD